MGAGVGKMKIVAYDSETMNANHMKDLQKEENRRNYLKKIVKPRIWAKINKEIKNRRTDTIKVNNALSRGRDYYDRLTYSSQYFDKQSNSVLFAERTVNGKIFIPLINEILYELIKEGKDISKDGSAGGGWTVEGMIKTFDSNQVYSYDFRYGLYLKDVDLILKPLSSQKESFHRGTSSHDTSAEHSLVIYECSDKCVVCLSNVAEVFLSPCNHKCICRDCTEITELKTCPICRNLVDKIMIIGEISKR